MRNVIYYFSGTGNSLAVARKIAYQLGETKLLKIQYDQNEIDTTQYDRVGIVFPVYYYQMPVLVENFVKKLIMKKKQYKFGVATHGRMRGIALEGLRNQVNIMGHELDGEFSVMMPGNYIVEYSAFPNVYNNIVYLKSEKTIRNIVNIIGQKQCAGPEGTRFFEKLVLNNEKLREKTINKRYDLAILDAGFHCNGNCNSCGICIKVCPAQNIHIENVHLVWEHKCEQCMACIQWCPNNSINYHDKTQKRTRYHHAEVSLKDMLNN
ncbi:MAG TPA: EFR1 family ferrodoxin [Ruminiclostridium sp.]